MFTIENLKNGLINHSLALKHTFDENGNPRQGALIADKGTVFFIPSNPNEGERSKWVMTTVSKLDDENLTKIECNRMAKEFVKKIFVIRTSRRIFECVFKPSGMERRND